MSITHLPATATVDEIHEVLHRDAALVIDDLATAEQIDAIITEMAPFIDATHPAATTSRGATPSAPVR